MAPVAAAALVMIASLMTIAVLIGAIGGVITALLKRDLIWGLLATLVIYLALSPLVSKLIGPLVGLLPLVLTCSVSGLSTGWLQARMARPLAALLGLILGLAAGFLYLLPLRFGSWVPMDRATPWIALVILLALAIRSLRARRRVPALPPPSASS